MWKDYFDLSLKSLRHRGIRSWLTILGIFIGIAAVVALISMGAGLREAVIGQFGGLNADTLTLQNKGSGFGPPGSTVVEKLNDNDINILESISGVKIIIPRLVRVVNFQYNDISKFKYTTTIPVEQDQINEMYENLGLEAEEGLLIDASDRGKILIGSDFAGEDGEEFEKEIKVGKKVLINGESFEVVGILKKLSSFQLNTVFFIPQKDLEKIDNAEGEYDIIAIRVYDEKDIEETAEIISERLRRDRGEKLGEESFTIETPLQSLEAIDNVLNIVNLIVIGIAAISLLVGGIGIANTMYTSVIERTKEIGIMKAIGAKNLDILFIFLIESGLLGLVGGIVGAAIGLGSAFGISAIANSFFGENIFRITISYNLLIGAILFSFLVGIVSGVLPAVQASKLNVVDALRK